MRFVEKTTSDPFSASLGGWWEWIHQDKIKQALRPGTILVLGACSTDKMAQAIGKDSNVSAVIGTSVNIRIENVKPLIDLFIDGLRKGKTIREAVAYANSEFAKKWKARVNELEIPRLTCYGKDIDKTVAELRAGKFDAGKPGK